MLLLNCHGAGEARDPAHAALLALLWRIPWNYPVRRTLSS
jgi:hypothetical protein